MLSDAGLIAPMSDDAEMYEVTGEGQRYLKGDLDAEHQPRSRGQSRRPESKVGQRRISSN